MEVASLENVGKQREAFSQAADTVRRRLGWRDFLGLLRASHLWAGGAAVLLVLILRLTGSRGGEWVWVLALCGAWLLGLLIWVWTRRPGALRSLAVWDEASDAKDTYSSAYFFASKPEIEEGEKRHIARAQEKLPAALKGISAALPMPVVKWAWVAPLVALVFAISPLFRAGIAVGDAPLTPDMQAQAEEEAKDVERLTKDIEKIKALAENAEKRELDELKESLESMGEELGEASGKTAREVLAAVEARARAAEKLAEKFSAASDEWASEEMLREMSQQADTADLAAAIKDKDADLTADQADLVANKLRDPDITEEIEGRVNVGLQKTMAKATDDDRQKPVGERVGNASRKMEMKQPKPAGNEFEELAKHFRRVAQREKAQEELQKLAEQLRESGSQISGAKLEQMKKLAGSAGKQAPKGLEPLQPGNGQGMQNMPQGTLAQTPAGQQPGAGSQSLPMPGFQNAPQGQQSQGQMGAAPVPGSQGQQPSQQGKPMQGMMASGNQGQQGQPQGMMSAPIPGMNPGSGSPSAALGGQGAASASSQAAGLGGQEAGNGTTGLGNAQTGAIKAGKDATVVAQINESGESTMRAVEGQTRQEQAQRDRQAAAVEFIKVQEDALDEQSLPLSRREHVIRYFSALKERFEEK